MMTTRLDHYGTSQSPAGVLFGTMKSIVDRLKEFNSRRGLRRMLDLDHRILSDVGVTRADVNWALGLPWSRKAAVDLQWIARLRRSALSRSSRP